MGSTFRSWRPTSILLGLFILLGVLIAAPIGLAARLPTLGVSQASPGSDTVRLTRSGDPVGEYRILAIRSAGGEVVRNIVASDFLAWEVAPPTPPQLARQDALARIARSSAVTLDVASDRGEQQIVRTVRPAGFHWRAIGVLLLALALCAGVGAWILALQPARLSTVTAALSGFGLMLAGLPLIIPLTGEWIYGSPIIITVFHVNAIATQLFGAALLGLFARYPAPLLGKRVTTLLMTSQGVAGLVAIAIPHLPTGIGLLNIVVLVEGLGIISLVFAQWRASRRDPRARAFVRWIGAAVLLSILAFFGLHQVPVMLGYAPLVGTSGQIVVFVPFYLALVIGVVRFRALDLERWSLAVLGYAALALLLGLTDAALMFALNMAPNRAALLALSLTLGAWLVLRDRVRRRLLRNGPRERQDLLRLAVQVVLVRDPATRAQHWLSTLRQLFEPLEVAPASVQVDIPRLAEDGLALLMPAVAGSASLELRHARGGRSLFGPVDLRIAQEFASLCAAVDEDRDAYDRGVREERDRIARDLHDDVGARLLSSLHRKDTGAVRGDVRAALADMRLIIGGLIGERVALGACLAALRQESAERAVAAGLILQWPTDPLPVDPQLDYAVAKNLSSALRELVTNAIRHSGGSTLTVEPALADGWLRIAVTDDGVGLDRASAPKSNGLGNVGERLARLGGDMRIEAQASGARIVIRLPLATPWSGYGPAQPCISGLGDGGR